MAAIAGVDEDLSLRAHLLADDFSAAVARERMLAVLAALFGGLALLLAGIGLYGVVSYGVGVRRTDLASAWTWVQIGPAWSASSCGGLLLSCAWASLPESRPAS